MKPMVRLALLGSVSSAATFLLAGSAAAQDTRCAQGGTTVTCVEGMTTVLTATVPATTVAVPGPGLALVNAGDAATIPYRTIGPIATTGAPAVTLTSIGGPIAFVPVMGGAGVNIRTTGAGASGLTIDAPGQVVTATIGNVSTNGTGATGVLVSGSRILTLVTGNVTATGAASTGIDASNQTGNVSVEAGNVTATDRAVRLVSPAGDARLIAGDIVAGPCGVLVEGANGATVVVGSVTTSNATATGGYGIAASVADNNIVIESGAISTQNGVGIRAINTTRDNTTTGYIDIRGDSYIVTTGDDAHAIAAQTDTGVLNIRRGALTTSGANSFGVLARSNTGIIGVTTTSITTTGTGSTGMYIATAGPGPGYTYAVDAVYGNITTSGAPGPGGSASALEIASGGPVVLRGAGATLRTDGAGTTAVRIAGAGVTGDLGNVTTTGANAAGAVITSTAPVNLTIGTVATTGNGVTVNARGNAATLTTGAVTATTAGATGTMVSGNTVTFTGGRQVANGANALNISGGSGAVNATVAGAATTGTAGAIVITGIAGLLTLTDTVGTTTTGNNSNAITVGSTGSIAINSTFVSTVGDNSRGINASTVAPSANSDGSVRVTSAGGLTTGANAPVISASSYSGPVAVTLTGPNRAANSDGVLVTGSLTATLTIASIGALESNLNAANMYSARGTTVTNAGSINGAVAALRVGGGSAIIVNSGTITGRLLTTDNADTFTNSGTFNDPGGSNFGSGDDTVNNSGTFNANGSNTFGTGTDTFNNSGTLNVLRSATAAGTVTFGSIEAFTNTGLIDLRNGRVGDTLVLPGTYVGTAGRLGLDASLGVASGTADVLRVGGIATGTTTITLNQVNTTPAVLSSAAGTRLVQAGGPSAGGAFTLDAAQIDQGLIQYNIVYNQNTLSYNLVATPGIGVFRTARVAQGARNLWLQSGDAWSGHMRELRDNVAANGGGGAGGRVWGQIIGQVEQRTGTRALSFNNVTALFNTGVRQDYFGGQLGVDFGGPAGDSPEAGGFAFGVTGGYLSSILNFNGSPDRVKYDAVNGGVYATYSGGIFFVNVLGKYDYIWGRNRSVTGRFSQKIDGSVYGGKAEAGFRLGKTFFIEPSASVSYTHSDIDDFATQNGTFSFDDRDGVRGKGGARIGTMLNNSPSKVTLYAGGNYVHEFKDRDGVTFVSGGQTVAFRQGKTRNYGEGLVGVNVGSDAGKVSGFIEGRYANGGHYDGYGGRAGMRFRF